MPLAQKKLDFYKSLLLEERQEILSDIIDSEKDYKDLTEATTDGDMVDQAYNFYEKSLLIGISDREKETLGKIEEALKRIENKSYGYCSITGKEIDSERLEAIPYTSVCAEEAKRLSKQRLPDGSKTSDTEL